MRLFLLAVCSLAFTLGSNAQDSDFTDAELTEISSGVSNDYFIANKGRQVEGNPYLNEDLLRGFVKIDDNTKSGEVYLRFNIEDNILEFAKRGELYVIDSEKIDGFTLFARPDDIVFKNGFRSEEFDINSSTFLRIIYEGKLKLLAHHKSSLKKDLATYGTPSLDRYVNDTKYYIVDGAGEFSRIKLKRRDVLKALDEGQKDKLLKFARQESLKFDQESDLTRILRFYDQLTESGS